MCLWSVWYVMTSKEFKTKNRSETKNSMDRRPIFSVGLIFCDFFLRAQWQAHKGYLCNYLCITIVRYLPSFSDILAIKYAWLCLAGVNLFNTFQTHEVGTDVLMKRLVCNDFKRIQNKKPFRNKEFDGPKANFFCWVDFLRFFPSRAMTGP